MASVTQSLGRVGVPRQIVRPELRSRFQPWKWLRTQKLGFIVPAALLTLMVAASLLAGVIAPYDPNALDIQNMLAKPSADHLLGTDQLGRDTLSRILFGGRTTMFIALIATVISITIGLIVGMVAGYFGGLIDLVISNLLTVLLSVPSLLHTLAILGLFGTGNSTLLVALIGAGWVGPARIIRSSVLSLRETVYVEAALSIGSDRRRILFRHIFPNLVTSVVVLATLDVGGLVLAISSLSFLGLGVQPPNADWGTMLNDARTYFGQYPVLALAPGVCISLVALLCNLVGDALRDIVDIGK